MATLIPPSSKPTLKALKKLDDCYPGTKEPLLGSLQECGQRYDEQLMRQLICLSRSVDHGHLALWSQAEDVLNDLVKICPGLTYDINQFAKRIKSLNENKILNKFKRLALRRKLFDQRNPNDLGVFPIYQCHFQTRNSPFYDAILHLMGSRELTMPGPPDSRKVVHKQKWRGRVVVPTGLAMRDIWCCPLCNWQPDPEQGTLGPLYP